MNKEFFNILKKGVWHRRKAYASVIACGSMMTAVVFFTSALGDCINLITEGKEAGVVSEHATVQAFLPSYILFFLLFAMSILRYVRIRYYDYEMLNLLGMRRKHQRWFIVYEYIGMFLGSLIGGNILGVLSSNVLCKVLEIIFSDVIENVTYGISPFKLTLALMPVLFVFQFVFLDTMRNIFGLDDLIRIGKKGGKEVYFSKVFAITGAVILLFGVISTATFIGELFPRMPLMIGLAGAFFLMKYSTSYFFVKWKKNESKYFRQIVWLDNWYHQFQYHLNMCFIMVGFFVMSVSSFMVNIMDCMPFLEHDHYPYDLVWMADETDDAFLIELETKYGVTIETHPSIRITAPERAEHMGISESEYEKWTRNDISLEEDEIFIVYQRERMERDQMEVDYGKKQPRFHLGSPKEELWLHSVLALGSEAFTHHYNVAGIEDRVLTGVFKNGVSEDIIVLNDQVFEKAHQEVDGSKLTVLMTIPDNHKKEVIESVRAYAKEHSQVDFFSEIGANLIYEKREETLISRERKLILLTTLLIDTFVLVAAVAFAFSEKMYNDEDGIVEKNKFYFLSGMTQENRRKSIKKEVWTTTKYTISWASGISIAYVVVKLMLKKLSFDWIGWYVGGIGLGMAVVLGMLVIMTWLVVGRIQKKLERGISDGK